MSSESTHAVTPRARLDEGKLFPRAPHRSSRGFRGRSIPVSIAFIFTLIIGFVISIYALPAATPYALDLGEACVEACITRQESHLRMGALLTFLAAAITGGALFWFGRTPRSGRAAVWILWIGIYIGFFAGAWYVTTARG